MEILFMVFMVVVSIMALFAVMVVFRDVVKEILVSRRERDDESRNVVRHAERLIAELEAARALANETAPVAGPVVAEVVPAPVEEEKVEEPAEVAPEAPVVETVEAPEQNADGTISFAKGQQQTIEEKYLALPQEQRGWFDEIIKYASAVEGSKRVKNARYEEYKVGNSRIVRMLIKRGVIHCEFVLHNPDFKNYVNENKISVRQSATTMRIDNRETVDAAKNSIDIVVAAIAEEKEYKKQLARERRKAAKAAATGEDK